MHPFSWRPPLSKIVKKLLGLWLPDQCIVCGDIYPETLPWRGICQRCAKSFPGMYQLRCVRCGLSVAASPGEQKEKTHTPTQEERGLLHPQRHRGVCSACEKTPSGFDVTIVGADYAPPIDRLVHALKFNRDIHLAKPLGEWLSEKVKAFRVTPPGSTEAEPLETLWHHRPAITAVPLSPKRLAERGFNQSLELARCLSRVLKLPLAPNLLVRPHHLSTPTSQMSAAERRIALHESVLPGPRLPTETVILVDDVMTTGETLLACHLALKQAGARNVINCVLARTPRDAPSSPKKGMAKSQHR